MDEDFSSYSAIFCGPHPAIINYSMKYIRWNQYPIFLVIYEAFFINKTIYQQFEYDIEF